MSLNQEFYCLRADEAREAASAATLDNVRDRHLGAAAAWDAMADRAARTTRARLDTEVRKAAAAALLAAQIEADAASEAASQGPMLTASETKPVG